VPDERGEEKDLFSLEENFNQLDEIFNRYNKDSFYLLVRPVFDFLRFEFYHLSGQKVKALSDLDDINAEVIGLLQYFKFYTFPSLFLISKLEIYADMGREYELAKENLDSLIEHEPSNEDIGAFLNYHIYLAVSSYYEGSFDTAARILQDARNEISFKGLTHIDIEIKLLLALQYAHLNEFELTGQLIKSIQRQVRNAEEKEYEDASLFIKMLNKLANSQPEKALEYLEKFNELKRNEDSVLPYLRVKTIFFKN
jgi:tetratricopeptide (TPR) repeat protein